MKFIVTPDIFEKLPDMYVGVVVAKGIDNSKNYPEIDRLLNRYMKYSQQKFDGINVKQNDEIIPYREAFRKIVSILIDILVLQKLCLNVYPKERICHTLIR